MKNILVVFGGKSAEHDVSIVTALLAVIPSIQASGKYNVIPFYISQEGNWYSHPSFTELKTFQDGEFIRFLSKLYPVKIYAENGFYISLPQKTFLPGSKAATTQIDVVFPAMHGTFGEDGSLMGLLRMASVPFVGCDLAASVIAMDKVLTKQITGSVGLPSVRFKTFTALDWEVSKEALRNELQTHKMPLFVKPTHLGSSIGISRVETYQELENAIEVALHYDDKVIIEEAVTNLIEVTVPVIGNDTIVTGLVERALNTEALFSFDEKYMHGGKKNGGKSGYSELPAKIDQALIKKCEDLAIASYRAIGASGIARIDLLIDSETNEVYLNEINTMPGSLYHHNWKAAGVSHVELVDRLINLALERFASQSTLHYSFKSTILSQFE